MNLEFLWWEFQHVIEERSSSTEGMFNAKWEVAINLRDIKILFFFPQVLIYHYFWNGNSLSSLISLTVLLWSLPPWSKPPSSLTWITAEWRLLPASLAPLQPTTLLQPHWHTCDTSGVLLPQCFCLFCLLYLAYIFFFQILTHFIHSFLFWSLIK